MKPIPILFGKDFWSRVNFEAIAEEGTISKKDLDLFRWCETADEAEYLCEFYELLLIRRRGIAHGLMAQRTRAFA